MNWIRNAFLAAALVNLAGVPICTRALTNSYLMSIDPVLFSRSSLILIMIWGLAYLGLSRHFRRAPYVVLAFAAEKLFYGVSWILWVLGEHPPLAEIWLRDWMTGFFYTFYGLIDGGFGFFFLWVFFRFRNSPDQPSS